MQRYHLFFIGLSVSLVFFSLNTPLASNASLKASDIVFQVNKNLVDVNESISFFVGLENGGLWQAGSVTLKDITTNTQKNYNLNAELTIVTDFLLNSPEGRHIIEVTDGSIVKSLNVTVLANTGPVSTSVSASVSNSSPKTASSIVISAELDNPSQEFAYFDGSQSLYAKSNGLINSPILSSHWFPAGMVFFPITVNITVILPSWHPLGAYNLEIGFSGDDTFASSTQIIGIFITSDDFLLDIYPNSSEIDRSSENQTTYISINLVLGGAEIALDNLYYNISLVTDNGTFPLNTPYLIGNRDRTVIVNIPTLIPLGDVVLNVDIIDGSGVIFFSNHTSVLIYDTIDMELIASSSTIRAGDTINYLVLTSLTDRSNRLVEASIIVKNTTDIIGSGMTTSGEWTFSYLVPDDLVLGQYIMIWELTPIGENTSIIRNNTITKQFLVSRPTEFHVTNFPSQIFRNQFLNFNIQLLSGTFPLTGNVGSFDIYLQSDLSLIGSYQVNITQDIQLFITNDIPKGNYDLQLVYDGTGIYESSIKDLTVKVISRPFFRNVLTNASGGVVGETIKISGYLLEEDTNNSPVNNAEIEVLVSDGSTQWIDGTTLTDVIGAFSYDLLITDSLSVGIHFAKLSYTGDQNTYGQSSNEPIVNFDKENILSLAISSLIYSGQEFNFSASGKLNGHYALQYLDTTGQEWIFIQNVTLDNQGNYVGQAYSPDLKGPIFFRIFDLNDNSTFLIQERIIYKIPEAKITLEGKIFSKKETTFLFYANELYVVYLNDLRITPSTQSWFLEEYYQYTFNHPGDYKLTIELLGEYLTFYNISKEITVYEDYEIIKSVPNSITEGSSITVNIQIRGKSIGFIQDVLVQIVNTRTELVIAEGLTQVNGNITLNAIIFGAETEIFIKIPKQKIGQYYLEEQILKLVDEIKRKIDISVEQEYYFTVNNKNSLNLKATFTATNNPVSDVPFGISIYKFDTLISEFTITSNMDGRIDIPLGTLGEGEYQVYIRPASDDFAPFVLVTNIIISSNDVFKDIGSISVVIIGAILLVGLGVVTRLKT
ncbi:MAG: hypothetical protein HeimC3_13010 [Candidatus Heimdallarchaeota archaeon LC_3]|nr:MAG: hypothetical protein HeimC3_15940 [Candidatus Heimdallarchaeota archaeon LC_3]OLS26027.1 MAG: hypothetical protein HeimC3_13010 [Candidatus Heimdallarchaeota archaeon LC_3]